MAFRWELIEEINSTMNQYEIAAEIEDEFPQLHKELRHLAVLGNAYESMNSLVTITRQMIASHHFLQVKKCMKIADEIYSRGNAVVKSAVENIFVYSFSIIRASCNKVEWRVVQSLIPPKLFLVYMKQVTSTAC